MENLSPSDLKSILHSKRANIYYLQHCRILVNGGRVEYVTDEGRRSLYWNIPIANSICLMLGTGTSITQAAMRELAKAGVLVGFCGGGGTPLYIANEAEVEVAWFTPQNEYRPTQYLQGWVRFWFDNGQRLEAAKKLQLSRLLRVRDSWLNYGPFLDKGFKVDSKELVSLLDKTQEGVEKAKDVSELLLIEGRLTKSLFKVAATTVKYGDFVRAKRGTGVDPANRFLDHGNYLAYGLGAVATWVLGLPHGLSVLHGKTRRGGLVFDAADLVKDAIVLPQAFISAMAGHAEQEFREDCIANFTRTEALDFIIEVLKGLTNELGGLSK